MLCVGHNTPIPFNPLNQAGETEAQFEKGEKLVDEHHANSGQPLPNLGWQLQIFLEMSDARVGGEHSQTRKQTAN